LDGIGGWVLGVIEALGYVGLALLLLVENLFPPIPSEIVLPLAGFLVGTGNLSFVGALLAATTGSVVGAVVLYYVGRWGGRGVILRYGHVLRFKPEELDRAEGWFRRYGDGVVLVCRVIPIARSIVSIPAGTARMPMTRFVVLTAIGSGVWNAALIGAGAALGANWEAVSHWVGTYSNVVLVALAAAAALFIALRILQRRRRKGSV
jgi:membrane protein DedA with SNARE-associated domain